MIELFLYKFSIHSEFLMFQSNFFHSIKAEGKTVFSKKSRFTVITGILLHCFVLYNILCVGMIEWKKFGDCNFSIW